MQEPAANVCQADLEAQSCEGANCGPCALTQECQEQSCTIRCSQPAQKLLSPYSQLTQHTVTYHHKMHACLCWDALMNHCEHKLPLPVLSCNLPSSDLHITLKSIKALLGKSKHVREGDSSRNGGASLHNCLHLTCEHHTHTCRCCAR